ncbi:hypothetical protein F4813DRAFT_342452 [Daldinia decipiens]|uniref:uncharacterized protein n=1 Tax=Daldinia decipiens TaxID=326647 RepID=UPI0020C50099|nr:uncharacterized protein F4813DRAFT_342452 [Daldinia decipiens]KAI1662953.1 hypothetical protein F4813DRAFT_342452 [Daldinia decipiens]
MEQATPRSFLDIPATIRRRIYCAAGLVTNTNIHMSHEERRGIRLRMRPKDYEDVPDLTFSLNLLITCRAIYKEVSHLLFSTNYFCIKDPQSLYQLPTSFISSLSSLKFSPNAIYPRDCCGGYSKSLSNIKPIVSTIPDHRSLLERWENAVRFISSQIKPQNFKLGLICDVADEETACLAVKPLRYLPTLSSCEIRLSHKPDSQLQDIARKAALDALGQQPVEQPPESFPFLRLPLEIQLEILKYTDLVTPLSHVQWISSDKYHLETYSCEEPHEPPFHTCHPNAHRACTGDRDQCRVSCPHRRCSNCTHYACQFQTCGRKLEGKYACITGCFCSVRHASYSPRCRCWQPPIPLFLVSKEFYAAAQNVFFSMNHITINYDYSIFPEFEKATVEYFTSFISSYALHNLRSLEIHMYYPDFSQWIQTVHYIKDKLINLQYLFLIVSPGFLPSWPEFPDTNPYPRPTLAEERGIDIVRESVDYVWPVRYIGSPSSAIRLFFVEFSFEGTSVYYYKRHKQEHLPTTMIRMDITNIQSVEVHVEREVFSDLICEVDDSSLALKSRSSVWVEGILARPDPEGYDGYADG